MFFQDRGVDGAEIDVELDVAIVEIPGGEGGHFSEESGGHATAGEKEGGGRPVIGPAAAVFLHAAAKFAESHEGDAPEIPLGLEVGKKS